MIEDKIDIVMVNLPAAYLVFFYSNLTENLLFTPFVIGLESGKITFLAKAETALPVGPNSSSAHMYTETYYFSCECPSTFAKTTGKTVVTLHRALYCENCKE